MGTFLGKITSSSMYICSKVSRSQGLLSRIRSCLSLEASKRVYTSLLQPLFDYADVAWGEISEGCCKELHRIQNRAARIMLRNNTSNHAFCVLNWLNLASRRKMHKCILVFQCLNNVVPKYLTQYFTRNGIFKIMQLGEATTRTNQPTNPVLKVPRLPIVLKRCWPSILPYNLI